MSDDLLAGITDQSSQSSKGILRMKKWTVCNFLGWMFLPTVALAASYAPVADFSRVSTNPACRLTIMNESFLKHWTPPPNFFLAPPYPGATLISAIPSGKAQSHGQSYHTLPSAVLLSPDASDKIVQFYQERLGAGWHKAEALGMTYLYRTPQPLASGEVLNQLLMSKPGSIAHINIDGQVASCDQLLVPGAKTRITVVSPSRQ